MQKKKEFEVSNSLDDLFKPESKKGQVDSDKKQSLAFKPTSISSQKPISVEEAFADGQIIDINKKASSDDAKSASDTEQRFGVLPVESADKDGFIRCPPAIKKIPVTRKAFDQIILLAKAVNEVAKEKFGLDSEKMEVYCFLYSDQEHIKPDQPSLVTGIYIPYHIAAESTVNVSEEGMLDVAKFVKTSGKTLLGWAHSHGHYEVYSSDRDNINHQIILNETSNIFKSKHFQLKYMYSITVVESGDKFGVTLTQYPCGHTEQTNAEVELQGEEYSPEEKEAKFEEIKKQVVERVTLEKPSQTQSLEESMEDLTQELIAEFVRQLWKAKNLLIEGIPENRDKDLEILQTYLSKYDKLLVAGAEESFNTISKKLINILNGIKKEK
jgi:hypothetical protein